MSIRADGPPAVSICVAAHDDADVLAACLESVRLQTFQDFEVIVVDDASRDSTPDVLRGSAVPRLRWSRNRRNVGEARTMNRAISKARGRFIKPLHADDSLREDCLEQMVALASAHRVGFVFSRRSVSVDPPTSPALNAWRDRYAAIHEELGPLTPVNDGRRLFRRYVDRGILKNCFAEPSGVMLRREALEKVGGFHLQMVGHLDIDLLSRVCWGSDVGFVDEPLFDYRRSEGSASSRRQAQNLAFLDAAWSLEGLRRLPGLWADEALVRSLWRRQLREVAAELPNEIRLGPPLWKAGRALRLGCAVATPTKRSLHGRIEPVGATVPTQSSDPGEAHAHRSG